ncbi:MAG: cell division topological specificity factor MinE [Magnetococcales bacterium]|nr:cell division topological specificity factor MinE [Magnetococcales bacterium]
MSLLGSIFKSYRKKSASVAKERLQVLVALERSSRAGMPDYLTELQEDIFQVLAKYFPVERDQVKVQVEHQDGCEFLELNVPIVELEAGGGYTIRTQTQSA